MLVLLHNKINDSIEAKTYKSEKLARSLTQWIWTHGWKNNNELGKDSFHKNKVINLSDKFKLAAISSGEENKKENKK